MRRRSLRQPVLLLCMIAGALIRPEGLLAGEPDNWLAEVASLRSEQRYSELVSLLESRARAGEPMAQSLLGNLYADGEGVGEDKAVAAMWWHRAAEAGNVSAQLRLGLAYAAGDGVVEDVGQARTWLERAAQAGDVEAQYQLGRFYLPGAGAGADGALARSWLAMASDQGHREAARLLARLEHEALDRTPATQTPPAPGAAPPAAARATRTGLYFYGTQKGRKNAWAPIVTEIQNAATLSGAWVRDIPPGFRHPGKKEYLTPGQVIGRLRQAGAPGWLFYVRTTMLSNPPVWGIDEVAVECYDPDGVLMWSDRVRNKMGAARKPLQKIIGKTKTMLAEHRGAPCLRPEP